MKWTSCWRFATIVMRTHALYYMRRIIVSIFLLGYIIFVSILFFRSTVRVHCTILLNTTAVNLKEIERTALLAR